MGIPPLTALLCVASLQAKSVNEASLKNSAKNFMYLNTGKAKHIKKIHKEDEFFPDVKEFTAQLIANDSEFSTMFEATKNA